jgi:hypothetical protein
MWRLNFVKTFEIKKLIGLLCAAAAIIALPAPSGSAATYSRHYDISNGIEIHLFTPEDISANMTGRDQDGRLLLILDDGSTYTLVEDIADPVIANKGDGRFHPMNADWVVRAVDEIDLGGTTMNMAVEIYVLPCPRYYFPGSSTDGRRIFLSPGVYEIDRCITACTVTHEVGHVYQGVYMPADDEDGWYRYLSMRGIYGDPVYSPLAAHMNRPMEIFAEDFRYLFGSEDAVYSGTIENPNLPLPDRVPGIEEFIISLAAGDIASAGGGTLPGRRILSAANYPNPFNPTTIIHAELCADCQSSPRQVECRVYDIRGSLVSNLYSGRVSTEEIDIEWNGLSERGIPVSSGVYFFVLRVDNETATGKMFLVR